MKHKMAYIEAALDSIRFIWEFTEGYQLEDFLSDRKTQDAVIRNIEVIGQALKDYGVDFLVAADPDQPWQQIAGMRNVLAHEYFGVDIHLVWGVLSNHLISLQESLERIRGDADDNR